MTSSRDRVRVVVGCGALAVSLALASPAAAERTSTPGQLLLWLLSLSAQRDTTEPQKIDLNSATPEALAAIPGLDRRQAMRIIALRPYATLQDLARAGLSARFIQRLERLLTVNPPPAHSEAAPSRQSTPVGAPRSLGHAR